MNIAILGCGYVGIALTKYWKGKGHYLTATTRSPEKISRLADHADNVKVLSGNDVNALIDLLAFQDALVISLSADSPEAYESTYLQTAQALTTALTKAPRLSQLIYTSSTSVYGDHRGEMVDERTLLDPKYPTSRILADTEKQLMSLISHSRSTCILRLGEIYGPNRKISDRLRNLKGRTLPGTGTNLTNLIHLDDIVRAIDFVLNHQLNGIYNLCNDTHIPRKQLYEMLCTSENLPEVKWDHTRQSIHTSNKRVSNAKIKAAGYHFECHSPL